jgi:hypothetical protein
VRVLLVYEKLRRGKRRWGKTERYVVGEGGKLRDGKRKGAKCKAKQGVGGRGDSKNDGGGKPQGKADGPTRYYGIILLRYPSTCSPVLKPVYVASIILYKEHWMPGKGHAGIKGKERLFVIHFEAPHSTDMKP